MNNYIFNPPQQNYHDNQKIDLGDMRVSVLTNVEVPEGVSQVIFNNNTIVDMSYDSVVPEVVHNGYTFHAANGNICTGTYKPMELPNCNLFVYINPSNFNDSLSNCWKRYSGMSTSNIFNSYGICIGDHVTDCSEMFNNSRYYNQPVIIGNNVNNCCLMFNGCALYNQPINIPDKVNNCYCMFYNCQALNQPIIIGNNVTNCFRMFNGCSIFNQPVNIPDKVIDCCEMFNHCPEFNQPVTIGNNVINCYYMFHNCQNFNQPIIFGSNVTDCFRMLWACIKFDQPIILGSNVTNCFEMLYYCSNFNNNIYIKSTNITNCYRMLNNCSSSKIKRIFCPNLSPFLKTTSTASITGNSVTWTATADGYISATYNIYLYNFLPEDI